MSQVVQIVIVCLVLLSVATAQCLDSKPGTTPNLQEIMIGRCEEFNNLKQPATFCGQNKKNCSSLWEKFSGAIFYNPPCNLNRTRFFDFFDEAGHDVDAGKSMFWEGVYEFVHKYSAESHHRYITLEDTLPGFMADGGRWCGQETSPGYNMTFCAGFKDTLNCPWNSEFSFWTVASQKFAESASGEVHVMLNGTSGHAFSHDTFFGTWELPQLLPDRVTKVDIILVYLIGQLVRETCSSPSIGELTSQLDSRGINWKCRENPTDVKLLLCMDNPSHKDCNFASRGTGLWNTHLITYVCAVLKIFCM